MPGQRDQRPEQRHARDEGFRAVDRVEHPDELGILALAAEFLADDAVIGKPGRDQPPHRRLGLAVGNRDRRQVGFVVDRQFLAEIRPDRRPGGIGEVGRQRNERIEIDQCPPDLAGPGIPAYFSNSR